MNDCSCIKGEGAYNYEFKALSPFLITYTDLSDWMEHPNYKTPTSYIISITPPNFGSIDIVIDVTKANKLTSKELYGIEDKELPDGIYCITMTNCGYTYQTYRAVTRKLECCADKLYIEGESTDRLDDLIRLIKVSVEYNKISEAKELYKEAERILKQFNCYC